MADIDGTYTYFTVNNIFFLGGGFCVNTRVKVLCKQVLNIRSNIAILLTLNIFVTLFMTCSRSPRTTVLQYFCTAHLQMMWGDKTRVSVDIRLRPGPVLPPGESVWVFAAMWNPCCLWWVIFSCTHSRRLRHWARYGTTWRHPLNRKYITYCNAAGDDQATKMGSMRRRSREVWMYGSGDTDAQTVYVPFFSASPCTYMLCSILSLKYIVH